MSKETKTRNDPRAAGKTEKKPPKTYNSTTLNQNFRVLLCL
jgi:hypothetical protein